MYKAHFYPPYCLCEVAAQCERGFLGAVFKRSKNAVQSSPSGGFGRGCVGDREGAWYWGSGSAGKSKIWSELRG